MSTQSNSSSRYLTHELVIQILLRLPTASSLARFRCVSRSWRSLLSDPEFIRNFLFHHSSKDGTRLRIMIKRLCYDRSVYSLHRFDTLRHISTAAAAEEEEELPTAPYKVRWPNGSSQLDIVGHANGIFCIADGNSDGASDIILWNPETSETRVVPVSPFAHMSGFVVWGQQEQIGFGFDPESNDYKVVRTLQFTQGGNDNDDDDDDGDGNYSQDEEEEEVEEDESSLELSEVFSLRHGSWRKLQGGFTPGLLYSIPECHEGRYYWWWDEGPDGCSTFVSFDIRSEVFETVEVANPVGMSSDFSIRSVSLVKGSVVAVFSDMETVDEPNSLEVWALLNFAGEGWIKLYSIASTLLMNCVHPVGIWRNGRCFLQRYEDGELIVFDPEIGSIVTTDVQLQGEWQFFQIVPYAPSRISLSELA
ncbi:unnamed protein product [Linum tenue]|uniref:F-box domain-containing protein n=2 Tax=Linum tenue TaxID=586396 RepID=A0AAV0R8N8_9ROSI|nr:unnamed protein product [Linum tenue]